MAHRIELPTQGPASDTYDSSADAEADRTQQQRLLTALAAWDRALRRDEYGAWCIFGNSGKIYTWGDKARSKWLIVTGRRSATARLSFCEATIQGLRLHQLPTPEQAETIRDILGIRKRVTVEPALGLRSMSGPCTTTGTRNGQSQEHFPHQYVIVASPKEPNPANLQGQGVLRSSFGVRMLPFLILFGSALCGYALAPVYCWPASALGLLFVSWARHYALIRRGVDAGADDSVRDALLRSSFNALIASGACYWVGVAVRSASPW